MNRKVLFLTLCLILTVIISGCTTESPKSYFLNVTNTLSEASVKYWHGKIENTTEAKIWVYPNRTDFSIFSQVCPIHNETSEHVGFFSFYRLIDCDFSKIDTLKNSNDFKSKSSYIQLSSRKTNLVITEKISLVFSDLYANENVTDNDSIDAIITGMVNKMSDMGLMVYEIAAEGAASAYISRKISDCNESASCIDSLLGIMETATPRIMQEVKFDNDFINSCKQFLHDEERELINLVSSLKEGLLAEFIRAKYNANPNDYVSYNSECERSKKIYSLIYDAVLESVSEPVQKFYVTASFYMLITYGDTDSLDQIIG